MNNCFPVNVRYFPLLDFTIFKKKIFSIFSTIKCHSKFGKILMRKTAQIAKWLIYFLYGAGLKPDSVKF